MKPPDAFKELLENPLITDILINGPTQVFIDQGNGVTRAQDPDGKRITFQGGMELRTWVQTELAKVGKTWDARFPFVDTIFESGHRAQITFPPITSTALLVSLRRLPFHAAEKNHEKGREFAQNQARTRWGESQLFEILVDSVKAGKNIIVSGATGSGKTTLLNDLISFVPETERLLALEDTAELHPIHPHFISLLSRPPNADGFGEVTLRDLLKQALRMRPDRILLGECRGIEVLELLQSLNTGHRGSLATLHANSPRDALKRIELLCVLGAGGALPPAVAKEFIAGGIQKIAHVCREEKGGKRMIREVSSIEGKEGDAILLRPLK